VRTLWHWGSKTTSHRGWNHAHRTRRAADGLSGLFGSAGLNQSTRDRCSRLAAGRERGEHGRGESGVKLTGWAGDLQPAGIVGRVPRAPWLRNTTGQAAPLSAATRCINRPDSTRQWPTFILIQKLAVDSTVAVFFSLRCYSDLDRLELRYKLSTLLYFTASQSVYAALLLEIIA